MPLLVVRNFWKPDGPATNRCTVSSVQAQYSCLAPLIIDILSLISCAHIWPSVSDPTTPSAWPFLKGDLWIASDACASPGCTDMPTFLTSQSTSLRSSTQPFQITYGSGSAQGQLVSDRVELAGYAVEDQGFALVTSMAGAPSGGGGEESEAPLLTAPAAGIMGMGLQPLSSSRITPFWQVLAKQGLLSEPSFTFQIASTSTMLPGPQTTAQGGVFTLGTIDAAQYEGQIHWVDVAPGMERVGYWALPLDRVEVNGETITDVPVSSSESDGRANNLDQAGTRRQQRTRTAVIDTGTTLVGVPTSLARAVYSAIPGAYEYGSDGGVGGAGGQGMFIVPCRTEARVSFIFAGRAVSIAPSDLAHGTVDVQGRECMGAVFALDTSAPTPDMILGDSLLKSYFTAFTAVPGEQPRIGFAQPRAPVDGEGTATPVSASVRTATTGSVASAARQNPATLSNSGVGPSSPAPFMLPATGSQVYHAPGFPTPLGTPLSGAVHTPFPVHENTGGSSLSSRGVGSSLFLGPSRGVQALIGVGIAGTWAFMGSFLVL